MPKQLRPAAPPVSLAPPAAAASRRLLCRLTTLSQFQPPVPCHPPLLTCRWTDLHQLLTAENRAGVLRTAGRSGAEVMLVPLQGRDEAGGGAAAPVPIFAGFVASLLGGDFVRQVCARMHFTQPACKHACLLLAAALPAAADTHLRLHAPPCGCPCLQLLLTMRLPLVFDLDETLLVAKSQSQMAKELKALRDVRCVGAPVPGAPAAARLDQLERSGGHAGVACLHVLCCKMQRWRSSSATSRMAL